MTEARLNFIRTYPVVWVHVAVVLLALGFLLREQLIPAIMYAASSLWQIAPIAVAGMVVTALLMATGRSVCWCVPLAPGSSRPLFWYRSSDRCCGLWHHAITACRGAIRCRCVPRAVMAFLLSSAVTDPQMFAITASTLGVSLPVGKTVSALGIGVVGGVVTWVLVRAGWFHRPARESSMLRSFVPESACAGPNEVLWRFWTDPVCLELFKETFVRMAKLVIVLMSIAFAGEYFLKLYLPHDALSQFVGRDNPFAVPVAAVIGAPLYLDGYAALPLVRGLMERGMTVGPAIGVSHRGWHYQCVDRIPGSCAGTHARVCCVRRHGDCRFSDGRLGVRFSRRLSHGSMISAKQRLPRFSFCRYFSSSAIRHSLWCGHSQRRVFWCLSSPA